MQGRARAIQPAALAVRRSAPMAPSDTTSKSAAVFYGVYGFGFFVTLCIVGVYGIGIMPLFPLQLENAEWGLTWLLQTVFD